MSPPAVDVKNSKDQPAARRCAARPRPPRRRIPEIANRLQKSHARRSGGDAKSGQGELAQHRRLASDLETATRRGRGSLRRAQNNKKMRTNGSAGHSRRNTLLSNGHYRRVNATGAATPRCRAAPRALLLFQNNKKAVETLLSGAFARCFGIHRSQGKVAAKQLAGATVIAGHFRFNEIMATFEPHGAAARCCGQTGRGLPFSRGNELASVRPERPRPPAGVTAEGSRNARKRRGFRHLDTRNQPQWHTIGRKVQSAARSALLAAAQNGGQGT